MWFSFYLIGENPDTYILNHIKVKLMFMMVLNYLFLVFVLTFALTSTEQVAEVHAGSQACEVH